MRNAFRFVYEPQAFKMHIAMVALTLPIFVRSIFDLCIGLSQDARTNVGITDEVHSKEIFLFLITGIFFDYIPLIVQLASLIFMEGIEQVVLQLDYEKNTWSKLKDQENYEKR